MRLQNAVRGASVEAQNARADPKKGLVSSYDPARYAVKVALQPAGTITGWIPLGALWVGAGWGMYAPPSIGDMVEVTFEDGNLEAGQAGLKFFNDVDQPLAVQSGEFWLVHKSGAFFRLLNSGALTFSDGQGATVTMNGDGTMTSAATAWTHTGTITVDGDVVASGVSLVNHLTSGVQSGGGTSGPPV
jgi:phage baseplate assembly protein gpV